MKVKYLVQFSGPRVQIKPGDVREVPTNQAKCLIERGFAEPVAGEDVQETATFAPSPRTTAKKKKARKRVRSTANPSRGSASDTAAGSGPPEPSAD